MVRRIVIIIVMVLINNFQIKAQKLSFNIGFSYPVASNYSTVFDDRIYQYVYAAPFAKEPPGEYLTTTFNTPVYDQVRIANILGLNSKKSNYKLGFSIRYDLKNYFQFCFETQYFYSSTNVFYGFQNMLINLDENENYYSINSADVVDDKITINNWRNSYRLRVNYKLPTKSITKYFVSIAANYQFLIWSTYSSYLTENEDTYLNENNSNYDKNEYYNTRIFQDKLFSELRNDGFNYTGTIGVGLNRFGFQSGIDWNFSISKSRNPNYYYNFNQVVIYFKFKLLSISLFK